MTDALSKSHVTGLVANDQEVLRCPHLAFSELAEAGPVAWNETMKVFVVSGLEACRSAMSRPEEFSSANTEGPLAVEIFSGLARRARELPGMEKMVALGYGTLEEGSLLDADPPRHTRHRKTIDYAFRPRRVAALHDDMRAIVNRLIDAFIEDGEVDFFGQFAVRLPLEVAGQLMGIHPDRLDQIKSLVSELTLATFGRMEPLTEREWERLTKVRYDLDRALMAEFERRENDRLDDVFQALVDGGRGDDPLAIDEMVYTARVVLAGSHETTTALITNAMVHLCESPELMATVSSDPEQFNLFMDEVLRLDTPVEGVFRVATRDTELAGTPIPAGAPLIMLLGAANRDEQAFCRAGALDLERSRAGTPHIAFGRGPHSCPGAQLAKAETRIAYEAIFERLTNIRFAPQVKSREDLFYLPNWLLHSPMYLPIQFDARSAV